MSARGQTDDDDTGLLNDDDDLQAQLTGTLSLRVMLPGGVAYASDRFRMP